MSWTCRWRNVPAKSCPYARSDEFGAINAVLQAIDFKRVNEVKVHGYVESGFESVKEIFTSQINSMIEHEVQLCVYFRGRRVVDLWADSATSSHFDADSLVNIFSSGKSLEAVALASLVDKGLLAYSDPISKHWPEFSQQGKGEIRVADLMRHEAGMPTFDQTLRVADLWSENIKSNAVGSVIESQQPTVGPDGKIERRYHALTRGWVVNELFRRVDPESRTIGEYLHEEVSGPLGVDVAVGVGDERWSRVVNVHPLGFGYQFLQSLIPKALGRRIQHNFSHVLALFLRILPDFLKSRGLGAPVPIEGMNDLQIFNRRDFARGETPSANAHASARGLAKIAAMMAAGGKFEGREYLGHRAWHAMHAEPLKADMGGLLSTRFTQGGVDKYQPTPEGRRFDKALNDGREGFYGWMGLGGSIFQWHPQRQIGFAFVPTALHSLDVLNERGKNFQREVLICCEQLDSDT